MFITTGKKLNTKDELIALKLAEEFNFNYIKRGPSSLSQLMKSVEDCEVLIIAEESLRFISNNEIELFFHLNLSKIRISNQLKGNKDRLINIAGIKKGDSVLDCTMGLATDSIVLSHAIGKSGNIISIESEFIPYLLAREGLKIYKSGSEEIDNAMKRISVFNINHLDYMKTLPDKSFDIVYFDPMFREPQKAIALNPLRKIANGSAIKFDAIIEAKRIARKKIILKEQRNSGEFDRLGFEIKSGCKTRNFDYGVIDLG